jgi:hypothetical protein
MLTAKKIEQAAKVLKAHSIKPRADGTYRVNRNGGPQTMNRKPFTTELDLRKWVTRQAREGGGKVFWVEPSGGSSMGLPDCYVVLGPGQAVWLELKLGTRIRPKKGSDKAEVRFTIRPKQRQTIRFLRADSIPVFVLVAVAGTPDVVLIRQLEWVLAGKAPYTTPIQGFGEIKRAKTRG